MAGIKDYSPTPASNTDLFPEGMAPSAVNDGMRQVQADIRAWYNDAEWVIYGDGEGAHTISYVSGTSFTVNGVDVTDEYHAGRRVKVTGPTVGTLYGTIESSSFVTNTAVEVAWDSGALANDDLTVHLGILRAVNPSAPEATAAIRGSVELATSAEAAAGTDEQRAVTPKAGADTYARLATANTLTAAQAIESASATDDELLKIKRASGTPYANNNNFLLSLENTAAAHDAALLRWLSSARSHSLGMKLGSSDFVLTVNTSGTPVEAIRVNGTTGRISFDGEVVYPAAYWAKISPAPTVRDGFNIAGVTKEATGRYFVIVDRDFASNNWAPGCMLSHSTDSAIIGSSQAPGTGGVVYIIWGADGNIRDFDQDLFVWGFGEKA